MTEQNQILLYNFLPFFQFFVHSCILALSLPDVDWNQTVTPLSGLPEDILSAILYYLYAECLPSNLTEDCARQIISIVSTLPCGALIKLADLCELFLKHVALKKGKH